MQLEGCHVQCCAVMRQHNVCLSSFIHYQISYLIYWTVDMTVQVLV